MERIPKNAENRKHRVIKVEKVDGPEHRILIEPYSWDTTGEAYFIKEMVMDRHDIKSIVVVTSDYHLNRSMIIFRKTLGPGYIVEGVGVGTGL